MNERYNSERYADLTPYRAIRNIERREFEARNQKRPQTRVWRNPKTYIMSSPNLIVR